MNKYLFLLALVFSIGFSPIFAQDPPEQEEPFTSPNVPCASGTPVEQARCLLRPVEKYGILGASLTSLPQPLESLIGKRVRIKKTALRRYLRAESIEEGDLGGSLDQPIALYRKGTKKRSPVYARYFVIRDTSVPVLDAGASFPLDLDEVTWTYNNLTYYPGTASHVYINRIGASATKHNFKTAMITSNYERSKPERMGLFLSVELVQPRIKDAEGLDAIFPDPAFTEAQYDRLALLYLAASLRKGYWLVPAYLAAVEAGLPSPSDHPQGFNLNKWAERLEALLTTLKD